MEKPFTEVVTLVRKAEKEGSGFFVTMQTEDGFYTEFFFHPERDMLSDVYLEMEGNSDSKTDYMCIPIVEKILVEHEPDYVEFKIRKGHSSMVINVPRR